MTPITYNEAYKQTDPSATDDQRATAASNIMAGVAANDAYWQGRGEFEALKAHAQGHSEIVRNTGGETPPASEVSSTEATPIESTATASDGATLPAPSATGTDAATEPHLAPSPDNPNAAIAQLRQQLTDAGITPEV